MLMAAASGGTAGCRKGVWRQLREAAAAETKELFTAVQSTDARDCLQARSLGVTRLRYLPKKTGTSMPSLQSITNV